MFIYLSFVKEFIAENTPERHRVINPMCMYGVTAAFTFLQFVAVWSDGGLCYVLHGSPYMDKTPRQLQPTSIPSGDTDLCHQDPHATRLQGSVYSPVHVYVDHRDILVHTELDLRIRFCKMDI